MSWPIGLIAFDYQQFVIEQLLGAGSLCKAYRARIVATKETVCLKILRQQWRERPDFQQQMLNEAAVLQSLAHPHVVPLLGVGQMPNRALYLVLKWINGVTLTQFMRSFTTKTQINQNQEQIKQTLIELHSQGLTHGDLHAGNILIDRDHKAWLTDFSFARREQVQIKMSERVQEDWAAFEKIYQT